MITLKELAEKCDVSIATISNILNDKPNVSEETKERVLKIIKKTGYRPNYLARGLRAAYTKTIGLIIEDITEFSTPHIINGIMDTLENEGYRTILENLRFYAKWGHGWEKSDDYKYSIEDAINEFKMMRTDGIIYVASHARDITALPENIDVPFIISYAFSTKQNFPCIMIDDVTSAQEITDYLIANSGNDIAFITGVSGNIHTIKRLEGVKKALKAKGIPFKQSLTEIGDWKIDSGYNCCKKLMESGKKITSIFCFNDLMAAGACKYLQEIGKTPGKDISVAGFDNREISSYSNPPITTMEIPLFQIGQTSGQAILNLIEKKDIENNNIYIPCKLIDRGSVVKK